ncbi:sulfatase-like hydrolase/transferase [Niastella sp. MAH-29]|uniref:Sulfatase-like hydrolase/transferase n=1 Tax=Niastella soli TaxID=2821487 RepID=A0ABS3YQ08_9BACT|nr:sulfatase-like hydrolase/transferase [Niastella soli]
MRSLVQKGLAHRFGIILLLVFINLGISCATRLGLLLYTGRGFDWTISNLFGVFGIGLIYDLAISSYIIIPFVLHLWFTSEKLYAPAWRKWVIGLYLGLMVFFSISQLVPAEYNAALHWGVVALFGMRLLIYLLLAKKGPAFRMQWRKYVLCADIFLVTFLLLFNSISEYFFWNEFSTRYNFIAVDYLIYTNEVLGNIRESYPVVWIITGVLIVSFAIVWYLRRNIDRALRQAVSFQRRSVVALLLLIFPLITYFFVTNNWKRFSSNAYANELAANGLFEFGTAFFHNELDFYRFYRVLPDAEAFNIVRQQLETPNARFVSNDPFNLERQITYAEPERNMNVVMISVESFSADFMKAFGNDQNITPYLDSLAEKSMLFTNLYASGTRTVRGLEALSLSIPPTPGQSVVKRPDNGNMFSLGSVFRSKGYTTQYLYGGYGYFDNMNAFFSGNHYDVIDRNALRPDQIHYANIWGVADEDLFALTLQQLDSNYKTGKPFFSQVMTVSNHRPFTYPEGRIDIPPSRQAREGAVKYTDYAIGQFIRNASEKPWFKNTVFVIVADHCAGSAGSVELPVTGYHIPMLMYSPGNITPQKNDRLMAQIDIAPSILGLLKFNYRSKFFGQDIFSLPAGHERAFISTYQGLGYLKNGELIIQSPLQQVEQYKPDFTTGKAQKQPLNDSLVKQAIAYYQSASWLLKNNKYRN